MHFCNFVYFFVSSISWKHAFYLGKIDILKVFALMLETLKISIFPKENTYINKNSFLVADGKKYRNLVQK